MCSFLTGDGKRTAGKAKVANTCFGSAAISCIIICLKTKFHGPCTSSCPKNSELEQLPKLARTAMLHYAMLNATLHVKTIEGQKAIISFKILLCCHLITMLTINEPPHSALPYCYTFHCCCLVPQPLHKSAVMEAASCYVLRVTLHGVLHTSVLPILVQGIAVHLRKEADGVFSAPTFEGPYTNTTH